LERDKKVLEAENLAHRVEELEHESESLKSLVEAPEELPQEVQQAIQVRIEMLNSLLAGYITDNAQYGTLWHLGEGINREYGSVYELQPIGFSGVTSSLHPVF
jgi:DNA repair exonuclease SbcCD ATPase subunit